MITPLPTPFVDLSWQHHALKDEIIERLATIIEQSAFVLGDSVSEFEQEYARFCQTRYAVGVGNGTDALLLALMALDIGRGDEVIIAANTFVATAEAIAHSGARPVLVDVDPVSYNIDATKVEQSITDRTRAIIPVHLYGNPADMDTIVKIARRHNLCIIEDAAQAHGATYGGRPAGTLGDIGCFSFYPSKNLGAFGDAGAIVTNSENIALSVRELRDHGSVSKYDHRRVGFTSRLDSIQAAVLTVKLAHLGQWNLMRQRVARQYNDLLSHVPGVAVPSMPDERSTHVFHLYVIRVEAAVRDQLMDYLKERRISTGIHYPAPVHLTEAFSYLGYKPGTFPVSEGYSERTIPAYVSRAGKGASDPRSGIDKRFSGEKLIRSRG
jgi:dTDP-4-amino-4,6-dideoxygalactose transaminase